MLNEKELREAVDRRLSGLTASGDRRMRIRAAVMQNRREEKPVKNKKTLIVAIALAALVLTSALAVAERMNLFDFFGQYDARYAELAPSAMLEISEPVLLEHPQLGDVTAQIDSAYYDGKNLMLAYRISNCARAEVYTPTAEEIAAMELDSTDPFALVGNEPGHDVLAAYNAALDRGEPFGVRLYTVASLDHTYTEDGVDLGPWNGGKSDYDESGALCELLEYTGCLPEAAQGRESLTVWKTIRQNTATLWFDGEQCWLSHEAQEVGRIKATIPLTQE